MFKDSLGFPISIGGSLRTLVLSHVPYMTSQRKMSLGIGTRSSKMHSTLLKKRSVKNLFSKSTTRNSLLELKLMHLVLQQEESSHKSMRIVFGIWLRIDLSL